MDFRPNEIARLTYPDFVIALSGYNKRLEQQWDYTRHIMSYIATFTFGNSKFYKPQDVISLERDKHDVNQTQHITSNVQALSLLNKFAELLNINPHG